MDEYAMLLQIKCDYSRLNKLVHDLLSVDHTRAEVFVALSVLWERKDARTALSYAEKVSFFLTLNFCAKIFV
jgi:anaphase-promoting complex subunit 7